MSLPSQGGGGIPPPSGGIVGENRSTQSKTTVKSKRMGPLGSNGALLLGSHSVLFAPYLPCQTQLKFIDIAFKSNWNVILDKYEYC